MMIKDNESSFEPNRGGVKSKVNSQEDKSSEDRESPREREDTI